MPPLARRIAGVYRAPSSDLPSHRPDAPSIDAWPCFASLSPGEPSPVWRDRRCRPRRAGRAASIRARCRRPICRMAGRCRILICHRAVPACRPSWSRRSARLQRRAPATAPSTPGQRPASPRRRHAEHSRRRDRRPRGRHRGHPAAVAEDHQQDRGVLRPRQDHRPHHHLRRLDQSRRCSSARCASPRAPATPGPSTETAEHHRLRRGAGDRAGWRGEASVRRLDVRQRAPACTASSTRSMMSG